MAMIPSKLHFKPRSYALDDEQIEQIHLATAEQMKLENSHTYARKT